MLTTVAFPSAPPGGLDATLSEHLGHCEIFTLVTGDGPRVDDVRIVPNPHNERNGCMGPGKFLAQNGVRILITEGIGMRPLLGFNDVGISVLHNDGARSVREGIMALDEGRLGRFGLQHTCSGGGEHGHAAHGCH
jgi:predicted Fe-Mo cluster-binding NifX family protein